MQKPLDKEPGQNFKKENMTMMVTILCLCSMRQSFSVAQTPTTNRPKYMDLSDEKLSSMNVSYEDVETHAFKNQSSHNNTQTERKQPTTGIPTIWIVMATILFSTIVITPISDK